jgi:hypothetical protein
MAESVGMPTHERESVAAKDFIVANPIRNPVKLPGPLATA